jgi:phage repressor protein C with HTH and peptisase S24 domain
MAFKDTLQAVMTARGVNQSELGRRLGLESQSVNQWIKGKTVPRGARLQEVAEALGVTVSELLGVSPDEPSDQQPRPGARGIAVPELDVRAQGGSGADDAPLNGDGAHMVLAEWTLPVDYLRAYVTSPAAVRIIRIVGDSMEPHYAAGDRVLVDTSHNVPSPPGVYVIWDGFGLVLKHVEVLAGRRPATARLSSDNPAYAPYEVAVEDLKVQGRVMGKWVWK